MFGLEFLFWPALIALPLAGLPILLHLLYRRKSPVVLFSTLRFIQSSIQQTAARKRIQRWLLLACRALLLLLLIWAISQPVRMLASGLFSGKNVAAVIVIDTSYSMQYQVEGQTLMQQADATVNQLLRNQLAGAQVAIVRSDASGNRDGLFHPAADLLTNWVPMEPGSSPKPLSQRIEQAQELLSQQPADNKWLIVISDFQQHDFPRPVSSETAIHLAAIDLHADAPANNGIVRLAMDPAQPIPGVRSDVTLDLSGHAGSTMSVNVRLSAPDGTIAWQQENVVVHCDENGTANVRLPVNIPAQNWLFLTASLSGEDDMPWDNQRTTILGASARQRVTVLGNPSDRATIITRLALDPFTGRDTGWPFDVSVAQAITGGESAATVLIQKWPDAATARQWKQFAESGHRLILFVRPGLESTWGQLDPSVQEILLELLPSVPVTPADEDQAYIGANGSAAGSLHLPWLDENTSLEQLTITRMVGFAINSPEMRELIRMNPRRPRGNSKPLPLLVDRPVGKGHVYTVATLPDMLMGNLPEHPIFMQFMVMLSLPAWSPASASNTQIGSTLSLPTEPPTGKPTIQIESPDHAMAVVPPATDTQVASYTYGPVTTPGIYTWRQQGVNSPIAYSSVQLPGDESRLVYRPTSEILPAQAIVGRTYQDLEDHFQQITQPQPHWSGAIAAVLMLLCFEALMSAHVRPWPAFPLWKKLTRNA